MERLINMQEQKVIFTHKIDDVNFDLVDGTDGCVGCSFYNTHSQCPKKEDGYSVSCGIESNNIFVESLNQTAPTGEPTIEKPEPTNALNVQVGGGHYKNFGIQPVEYIHANNLSFLEGNVVKYITRHKAKNGIEDIKKVIHYCQLIMELEYNQKEVIATSENVKETK